MTETTETTINKLNAILKSLIFDRTQSDVDYALDCVKNAVYNAGDLKGAYNISDRNRIGGAVNNISEFLVNAGMFEARLNIKNDYDYGDIIRRGNHDEILAALKCLKFLLPYSQTPEIPASLDAITYQKANALERILYDSGGVLVQFLASWLYCGDGYASDFDAWSWQGWDN